MGVLFSGRKRKDRKYETHAERRRRGIRECWEDLIQAMVAQAAVDYVKARAILGRKRRRKRGGIAERIGEVEGFFRSRWFEDLTGMDGEEMIRRLKEEKIVCQWMNT
jgi:hypothetical protein